MTDTTKKSGFGFGSILSHFVEDVPDPPAKAAKVIPAAAPPIPLHPVMAFSSAPPPPSVVAADPNALAKLESKLQSALPPAYAAFMEQFDLLKDEKLDEGTRFRVALRTSRTSVEQLGQAFDLLLGVMETAKGEFERKFDSNKQTALTTAQQSIAATENLVASKEAQLSAITEEIKSLRAKQQTDTEQMHAEEARLNTIRLGFEAAHEQVVGRLNMQKAHIAQQRG